MKFARTSLAWLAIAALICFAAVQVSGEIREELAEIENVLPNQDVLTFWSKVASESKRGDSSESDSSSSSSEENRPRPSGRPTRPSGRPTRPPPSERPTRPSGRPTRPPPSGRPTRPPPSERPTRPSGRPTRPPPSERPTRPSGRPTRPPPSERPTRPSGRPTRPSGRPTRPPPSERPTRPSGRPTRPPPSERPTRPSGRPTRPPPSERPTTTSPPGGECDVVCRSGDHYLPNPADCGSFYQCSNGQPILQPCPEDLVFNPNLNVCDYPSDAPPCEPSTCSRVMLHYLVETTWHSEIARK